LNQKYLISIVGPTAIGKTALSILLANHFNTDIISADSRQFYREMSIGTAAPTLDELALATHRFIHHKSIEEDYNVGAFEKEAIEMLDSLFLTKDVVVMVGGSGLYIDAVTKGLDNFPEIDSSVREVLNLELETKGLTYLQDQLKLLDMDSYRTIAVDNPHRVIRALEVCIGSGQPYSSFLNRKKDTRSFNTVTIGLTAERNIIYDRINHRVDLMMTEGLLDEVKELLSKEHLNALNTVGYKELFNYFKGECTLEFAVSEIKKNSRRFAKRQLTWFKKNEDILWFDFRNNIQEIIKEVENLIEKK
jgi:tRNA dimethylallyltransferase